MTHKTGRPNHQLPTRLRVELPNALSPAYLQQVARTQPEPLSGG